MPTCGATLSSCDPQLTAVAERDRKFCLAQCPHVACRSTAGSAQQSFHPVEHLPHCQSCMSTAQQYTVDCVRVMTIGYRTSVHCTVEVRNSTRTSTVMTMATALCSLHTISDSPKGFQSLIPYTGTCRLSCSSRTNALYGLQQSYQRHSRVDAPCW